MKVPSLLVVLALAVGLAHAQSVPRIQSIGPSPAAIQPVDPAAASRAKDYEALYRKEAGKNRELRAEVQSLTQRIAEMTRPGGSLVQAYCESNSVSRNTAGARSDCAASGFACEQVSGLCRTSARSTSDCAAGFVYCATNASCVNTPEACR